MCEAVGHPVLALRRVAFGPLALGDLAPGAHRRLTRGRGRRAARRRRGCRERAGSAAEPTAGATGATVPATAGSVSSHIASMPPGRCRRPRGGSAAGRAAVLDAGDLERAGPGAGVTELGADGEEDRRAMGDAEAVGLELAALARLDRDPRLRELDAVVGEHEVGGHVAAGMDGGLEPVGLGPAENE